MSLSWILLAMKIVQWKSAIMTALTQRRLYLYTVHEFKVNKSLYSTGTNLKAYIKTTPINAWHDLIKTHNCWCAISLWSHSGRERQLNTKNLKCLYKQLRSRWVKAVMSAVCSKVINLESMKMKKTIMRFHPWGKNYIKQGGKKTNNHNDAQLLPLVSRVKINTSVAWNSFFLPMG